MLNNRRTAAGVSAEVALETADVKAGGRSLRFRAANSRDSSRGAWAQIGTAYQHPYFSMAPGDAMGLWVKGDGSGALLNVQIRSPREYHGCISDHYIDLDFTGWRYVELLLRERDSERLTDYVWPYGGGGSHAIYRNSVDQAHISEVNLLLNEIPAGGKVDILVSPIRALSTRQGDLANPSLEVAGAKVTFPMSLKSGQYIELESADDCVLYDERGELLSRFRPQAASLPRLAEGANTLRFDCTPPEGLSARAEVTVVSLGQPFGSRRAETEIDWSRLEREYEIPRVVTRTDGVDNLWSIVRRAEGPGGRQEAPPTLELEISVQQLAKPEARQVAAASRLAWTGRSLTIGQKSVNSPCGCWRASGSSAATRPRASSAPTEPRRLRASWPASSPTLSPGANRAMLDFGGKDAAEFRVIVKTVKRYR